ncbi:MAG TPA: hypothetical protein DEP05_06540 [Betaproteobacteria bacterium]|nr:hypothetical protein [Betaproteobacteria bacterium]
MRVANELKSLMINFHSTITYSILITNIIKLTATASEINIDTMFGVLKPNNCKNNPEEEKIAKSNHFRQLLDKAIVAPQCLQSFFR